MTTNTDRLISIEAKVDKLLALLPTPPPTPTPQPDPPPTGGPSAFRVGVVVVQNESAAGYTRSKDLPVRGQHYSQFGANSSTPSDAASIMGRMDAPDLELYAAIAPQSLDVNGAAYGGSNSRLKDTPQVQTFAQLCLDVASARPNVKSMNFWNELKGYYTSGTPGGWDAVRFCRDYVTWATIVKAKRPDLRLGGPYSTGQHGQNVSEGLDERVRYIHQTFIDSVVKPHPGLVDYIAWDDSDGSNHASYTSFYERRGIALPHVDTEWYPSPATAAGIALDMAANPLMERVMFWGGGSDAAEKAPLWNSSGTPTATLTAMVKVNALAAHRPVTKSGSTYTNALGQTLTVSGGSVS